jgi:hypothetical protein
VEAAISQPDQSVSRSQPVSQSLTRRDQRTAHQSVAREEQQNSKRMKGRSNDAARQTAPEKGTEPQRAHSLLSSH